MTRPGREAPQAQCIFCGGTKQLDPNPTLIDRDLVYSGTCDFDGFLLDATILYANLRPDEQLWVDAEVERIAEQRKNDPLYDAVMTISDSLPQRFEDILIRGVHQ